MIDYTASDGLCFLRLDNPPLNAVTFDLLDELRGEIERACADSDVYAIVILGRADHFSAGADINIFDSLVTADDAIRTSRLFQEAFDAIEASPKPVVAVLAGKVMGSALELAAACHYRVCELRTTFSMPEVNLGINPGAGGTQRLPRLLGPAAALRMMLTARPMGAAEAEQLGLVDAVCETDRLLGTARNLLARAEGPRPTRRLADKIGDAAANDQALVQAAKHAAKGRGEIIAPQGIIEAVRTGLAESFQAGLVKEQEIFAECMATQATRNKIYVFFATRKTGKVPELAGIGAASLARAAVVGMGSMGTGIAHALIIAGKPVVAFDEDAKALDRGKRRIHTSVRKRVDDGKMPADKAERMLALLTTTTHWADLAGADVVIEAVYEDAAVKQAVLAQVEALCGGEAVIATNTSTLSLDLLAEAMARPERLVGLHFFNPAHRMPLVEVIRREGTDPAVTAAAMKFARDLRKTPVLVRNREGFIVNRLFIPYLKEAFTLLEHGAEAREIDAAMVAFGFPMGPLALIDMAGIDILAATDAVLVEAFEHHGPLSPIVPRLVEAGLLGQKTGCGVYRYERGEYTPHDSDAAGRIIADVRAEARIEPYDVSGQEITDRLVLRMVAEASCVLQEGIAQRESDIDAATVLGIGWPDFRGGALKYARDAGPETIVERLDALAAALGPRFAACKMLRDLKGQP